MWEGVSLGSFCGAALTETTKLALVYGNDKSGQPYDQIEIDVFYGASAGAMSLGIMLRALGFPEKDNSERIKALNEQYSSGTVEGLSVQVREQLVDAQLAHFI